MLTRARGSRRAGTLTLASAFAAQIAFFFALTLVPFVGLTAAAATSWLPPSLGGALADTLERVVAGAEAARVLATLRQVALGLVLVLAMRVTYGFVPGLSRRVGRLWAGAAFAAGGWLASAWAFARLVPGLWRGRDLCGALASSLLFLLWSYANAWLLLLGGRVVGRGK